MRMNWSARLSWATEATSPPAAKATRPAREKRARRNRGDAGLTVLRDEAIGEFIGGSSLDWGTQNDGRGRAPENLHSLAPYCRNLRHYPLNADCYTAADLLGADSYALAGTRAGSHAQRSHRLKTRTHADRSKFV